MLEWWLAGWVPHSGRVFVDVGANVGTWSRWLASGFERGHAIEPDPDALVGLRAGLPDSVVVHPIAAWHRPGTLTFSRYAESVHTSAYFTDEGINTGPRRQKLELPCARLDDLVLDGPVDFLKCDVEGAEVEVIRGAAGLIDRDRPWLLIEVHAVPLFQQLARILADADYVFTVVRHPEYEPFSPLWYAHCWLSCQPAPGPPTPPGAPAAAGSRPAS